MSGKGVQAEPVACRECKEVFTVDAVVLEGLLHPGEWHCGKCLQGKVRCFSCGDLAPMRSSVQCTHKHCTNSFHPSCADLLPKAAPHEPLTKGSHPPPPFVCPHHFCAECKGTKSLLLCSGCPAAYHARCHPGGKLEKRGSSHWVKCFRHDEDWKGEKLTAPPSTNVKDAFERLPLPPKKTDFRVPRRLQEAVRKLAEQPPLYQHIKRNVWVIPKPKSKGREDESVERCDCKGEAAADACAKDCLCSLLFITCSKECGCSQGCQNVAFQKRAAPKLNLVKTEACGWGIEAGEDIPAGTFLVEYTGEVIDDKVCEERLWHKKAAGETNFYMVEVSRNMVVDAAEKGNYARFVNHSCEPNCELQKWQIDGETRIGIFTTQAVKEGTPLEYDYQFVQFGADTECRCGSARCRGRLGKSAPSEDGANKANGGRLVQKKINEMFPQSKEGAKRRLSAKVLRKRAEQLKAAEDLVGKRVEVWWPLDQMYYGGEVVAYDDARRLHRVRYDDSEVEWVDLMKERHSIVKPAMAPVLSSLSTPSSNPSGGPAPSSTAPSGAGGGSGRTRRSRGQQMVGQRVRVWDEGQGRYRTGTVELCNATQLTHTIAYDCGMRVQLDLSRHRWQLETTFHMPPEFCTPDPAEKAQGDALVGQRIALWWTVGKQQWHEAVVDRYYPGEKMHLIRYDSGITEDISLEEQEWRLLEPNTDGEPEADDGSLCIDDKLSQTTTDVPKISEVYHSPTKRRQAAVA